VVPDFDRTHRRPQRRGVWRRPRDSGCRITGRFPWCSRCWVFSSSAAAARTRTGKYKAAARAKLVCAHPPAPPTSVSALAPNTRPPHALPGSSCPPCSSLAHGGSGLEVSAWRLPASGPVDDVRCLKLSLAVHVPSPVLAGSNSKP